MPSYLIGGRSGTATNTSPVAQLWNPSSAVPLRVTDISFACVNANSASLGIYKTTARGTPGSTVTPDIDNDREKALAPPSGALLDLAAFSAGPTLGTNPDRIDTEAAVGSGIILWTPNIKVKPGNGLALVVLFLAPDVIGDVTFGWDE